MIIDKIENLEKYRSMSPLFPYAFRFFRQLIEQEVPDGKYILSDTKDENGVYIMIGTKAFEEKTELCAEAHKKYIDVQVVLSGGELMCVPSEIELKPLGEYNDEKDFTMYEAVPVQSCHRLNITEGSFAIFFDGELHIPESAMLGDTAQVRKAVIKVMAKYK